MNNSIRVFLISILGSLLAAIVFVIKQDFFGAGDLIPFMILTIPFAVLVSLIEEVARNFLLSKRILFSIVGMVLLGVSSAFICVFPYAFLLGPWIGAYSFPILPALITGGIVAFLSTLPFFKFNKIGLILRETVILMLLTVVISFGVQYLLLQTSSERKVNITFIEWKPGNLPSQIIDENGSLQQEDVEILGRLDQEGHLIFLSHRGRGSGIPVKVIFVIRSRLSGDFTFPVPAAGTVVYIIDTDGWTMVPQEARILSKGSLNLMIYDDPEEGARIEYEFPSGAKSGTTAFVWSSLGP